MNRAEIARRVADDVPGWALDPLLDAFEAGALEAIKTVKDRKAANAPKKRRAKPHGDT